MGKIKAGLKLERDIRRLIVNNIFNKIRVYHKQKIFCIGRNKTGTTSIKKAFSDLGFLVGDQRMAERLTSHYFEGNFQPIIRYCRTAQVFQDVPFSYPETFKHLDKAFPGSKFILTIRNSAEQWYESLIRFHSKKFGNGNIPTAEQLKDADYVWKGWVYQLLKLHNTTEDNPYDKNTLIQHYHEHNNAILKYFEKRPKDLLVVNLAERGSYHNFCKFLGIDSLFDKFPWENRTSEIK